jgi:hypothetical protein
MADFMLGNRALPIVLGGDQRRVSRSRAVAVADSEHIEPPATYTSRAGDSACGDVDEATAAVRCDGALNAPLLRTELTRTIADDCPMPSRCCANRRIDVPATPHVGPKMYRLWSENRSMQLMSKTHLF